MKATLEFLNHLLAQLRILNWGWNPRRHLAMSRGERGSGMLWHLVVQNRAAAKHSTMHSVPLPRHPAQNYQAQNISSARFGKSWPNWMDRLLCSFWQTPTHPLKSSTTVTFSLDLTQTTLHHTSQESQVPLHLGLLFPKHILPISSTELITVICNCIYSRVSLNWNNKNSSHELSI